MEGGSAPRVSSGNLTMELTWPLLKITTTFKSKIYLILLVRLRSGPTMVRSQPTFGNQPTIVISTLMGRITRIHAAECKNPYSSLQEEEPAVKEPAFKGTVLFKQPHAKTYSGTLGYIWPIWVGEAKLNGDNSVRSSWRKNLHTLCLRKIGCQSLTSQAGSH